LFVFKVGPVSWLCVPHGPAALTHSPSAVPALLDAIEDYAADIGAMFVQVMPFERAEHDERWEERAEGASLPYDPELPQGAEHAVSDELSRRAYQRKSYFDLLKVPCEGQIVRLGVEDLLSTFRSQTRYNIRRTQRSDEMEVVSVDSVESLAAAYGLLRRNAERYGGSVRPWSNFKSAVWPAIRAGCTLVLAAYWRDEPVCVNVTALGGNRGACLMGAAKRVDIGSLRPAHLLQYTAMIETRNRGFPEYDLTSLCGGGVGTFKRGFRPSYYRLSGSLVKTLRPGMLRSYLWLYPFVLGNRQRVAKVGRIVKTLLRR
jgi:hypothetical protein